MLSHNFSLSRDSGYIPVDLSSEFSLRAETLHVLSMNYPADLLRRRRCCRPPACPFFDSSSSPRGSSSLVFYCYSGATLVGWELWHAPVDGRWRRDLLYGASSHVQSARLQDREKYLQNGK